MRTCKLCSKQCTAGVHYTFRQGATGPVVAEYDVCWLCSKMRSQLIIPGRVIKPGLEAQQFGIEYESFGEIKPIEVKV
jgi:hypothetical protein